MDINDPEIQDLRAQVKTAAEAFDWAIALHEVWLTAGKDTALHSRLNDSYAGNAFRVIRIALRDQIILAITRLWDTNPDALRMSKIGATIKERPVIEALAADRAKRAFPGTESEMLRHLSKLAKEASALIAKYQKGGAGNSTREALMAWRHNRIAHHNITPAIVVGTAGIDEKEAETLFVDHAKLIDHLLSLVLAEAYNPLDTAKIYRIYAQYFWESVEGERSERHPRYKRPEVC